MMSSNGFQLVLYVEDMLFAIGRCALSCHCGMSVSLLDDDYRRRARLDDCSFMNHSGTYFGLPCTSCMVWASLVDRSEHI